MDIHRHAADTPGAKDKGLRRHADDLTTLCVLTTDIAQLVVCCCSVGRMGLFVSGLVLKLARLTLVAMSIGVSHAIKR